MQISPVKFHSYNYYNNRRNVPFSGTDNNSCKNLKLQRGQFISDGVIHNYHHTSFARPDLDWKNFSEYLKEKYPDGKVNILLFACSTGEEAYTMALLLNKTFPDKRIKIRAMDIDEDTINKCKQLQKSEEIAPQYVLYLNSELNLNEEESSDSFYQTCDKNYKFKHKISDMIEFETRNILEFPFGEYNNQPSVVLMRNMWFYVKENEHSQFAKNLYKSLAPNSTVIIGNIDAMRTKMHKKLLLAGFKYPSKNVSAKNKRIFFEKV